ncbi:DEAD/DEAH box helicase [Streptomyces sp. NPDC006012]|uniref:DEAD/DEAH box helicase n=1 Tax=Streptomyces sp. NPDC006012 TaxID=3364739 RepID=UPI0036A5EADC
MTRTATESAPSAARLLPDRLQATFRPCRTAPFRGALVLWGTQDPGAAAVRLLGTGPGEPYTLPTALPDGDRLVPARVPARLLPLGEALAALAALPEADDWPGWRRPGASLLVWSLAAKLALEHVAAGRLVPVLRRTDGHAGEPGGSGTGGGSEPPGGPESPGGSGATGGPGVATGASGGPNGRGAAVDGPRGRGGGSGGPADVPDVIAHWRLAAGDDERLAALARALPPAAHALRPADGPTVWSPADLLDAFCDAVADTVVRQARPPEPFPGPEPTAGNGWPSRWLSALTCDDPRLDGPGPSSFAALADWSAPALLPTPHARLSFRLDTPVGAAGTDGPDGSDNSNGSDGTWTLHFGLCATGSGGHAGPAGPGGLDGAAGQDGSAGHRAAVDARQVWEHDGGPFVLGGHTVTGPQDLLVRGLAEAARLFPPLDACLSERHPTAARLDPRTAADFLAHGVDVLTGAGMEVLLPDGLTQRHALRLRARFEEGETSGSAGGAASAGFHWQAALGDEPLTRAEFDGLAAARQPLVRFRDRWVHVDPERAARLRALLDRDGGPTGSEALAAALAGRLDTAELGEVHVVAEGVAEERLRRLRSAESTREPRIVGVDALLRDYQRRGVAWLQSRAEAGLGALLADDMGLGKTLQTICLLAGRFGDRPHLVVCPTSVAGNWERELARFAPALPVLRHHGQHRATRADQFAPGAVVVTTYTVLRRDAGLLAAVDWDVVVLDEAQQIKNPDAQAARAARRLPAAARVALTGTPVENRLTDLWSIMRFANPGLLGPYTRFKERFVVPVERSRDPDAAQRLRRTVAPFLLRRVKAEVAADLPPKVESVVACALTAEQATLYRQAVAAALRHGFGEGVARRGRILALLTALKQICNHPAQYTGRGGAPAGRSGKLDRLTEMLAEVLPSGERALVFTQYRVTGDLLAAHLGAELGLPDVPFLHGGTSTDARDRMVAAFQTDEDAPPLLLVSLRAGGFGLNLTRATQVFHYDRWWNPAVEDQATDRAHRIGQTRPVNVYKLVTAGTLEERVADLLERKRSLAESVVGTGETWLTELSDEALRSLVDLTDQGECE